DQQLAYTHLAQGLATNIGLMRAVLTSINRIWGADNANSMYWHHRQLQAVASYASQSADALQTLQPLFDDLQAAMAPDLPQFAVIVLDASDGLRARSFGLPPDEAALAAQLGVPFAQQKLMAD